MARQVCSICKRPQTVCFCHLIKPVENIWPVHIIQHSEETKHAIGTAKIAQLSLKTCRTEVVQDSNFVNEGAKGVLVYPGESNTTLAELKNQNPQPLIFIDASWRKSKKIFYESAYLQALPRVSFAFQQVSRYRIRKEPRAGYCSTLEAIAYMLTSLENESEKYESLLEVMDWMVERQIKLMGDAVFSKNY